MVEYFTKFTVQKGQGDALENILMEASKNTRTAPECILFVVARSPEDEDAVWTTEIWTSNEAEAAAMEKPEIKEITNKLLPILQGAPTRTGVRLVGGKGLPLVR